MTHGFVQRRHSCTSTSHMIVPIDTAARPAVKSTYELVQRLLLIGKVQFHISPAIISSAPPAKRPLMRSGRARFCDSHQPAMLPSSAVPTAPAVERTPSGSQVLLLAQR